jgi:hypothetical protein
MHHQTQRWAFSQSERSEKMSNRNPITEAIEAERARALATRAATQPQSKISRVDALERIRDDMAEALAYRLGGPEPERDEAIHYVGMGLGEMVRELLGFRGDRFATRQEMFSRAITSSDVPALLAGAGNRILRQAYESYQDGLLRFCGRVRSRDFRDVKAIQVDGDVALHPLGESGAIEEGSLKASAETYPISTFARSFGLTRQLFMEDDLAAFANVTSQLGRHAAEFVAAKVATVLEANAALSDGVTAFHSGHGNLGTAGALSEATVGELLKLMRAQVGLGGERIAVVPRALVVPGALEWTARKLIWLLGPQAPIEVVVEPRLTSATAFYVLADPSSVPAISYTFPDGGAGPTIELGRRPGFDGLRARVLLDLGCGFTDYRGAAKNVGA